MRDEYIKSIIESMRHTKKKVASCMANLPKNLPISSPTEWAVAHIVFEEDGITPKDLATRLGVTGSAVSQMVKNLESASLLIRSTDPNDKRLSHLHLSPHYKKLFGKMERIMVQNMAKTFDPLSDEELKMLAALHRKISTNA